MFLTSQNGFIDKIGRLWVPKSSNIFFLGLENFEIAHLFIRVRLKDSKFLALMGQHWLLGPYQIQTKLKSCPKRHDQSRPKEENRGTSIRSQNNPVCSTFATWHLVPSFSLLFMLSVEASRQRSLSLSLSLSLSSRVSFSAKQSSSVFYSVS